MALALRFAARSDVGLLRDINEDSGYAGPRLLAVADGMGGHVAGEVASSVTVAALAPLDEDSPGGGDLLDRLARAVKGANIQLRDMMRGDPHLDGMGTTLTALLRAGSRLGIAHVGDSRCYLLSPEGLQQITHDHTFVQTLVDQGRITADEADHHPHKAVIMRALDGRGEIDLDLSVREIQAGERYLLCSDGLTGVVSEDTLRDALLGIRDPGRACEELIALALRGGGPDNITCIVADVVDVDASPSAVPVVVGAAAENRADREASGAHPDHAAARAAALRPRPARQDEAVDPEQGGRRWPRRLVLLALLLALLAGGGWAAWSWSQNQYYVGADGEQVVIYRGLSQEVGGLSMSHVYEPQGLTLDELSPFSQARVERNIDAASLDDAREIVGRLQLEAERCAAQPAGCGGATP